MAPVIHKNTVLQGHPNEKLPIEKLLIKLESIEKSHNKILALYESLHSMVTINLPFVYSIATSLFSEIVSLNKKMLAQKKEIEREKQKVQKLRMKFQQSHKESTNKKSLAFMQARLLFLTAQKSSLELEHQSITQQRLYIANYITNYWNISVNGSKKTKSPNSEFSHLEKLDKKLEVAQKELLSLIEFRKLQILEINQDIRLNIQKSFKLLN